MPFVGLLTMYLQICGKRILF